MSSAEPLRDRSVLSLPEHVLTRGAADETVLLNLNNEEYYGLTGVGASFLSLVERHVTFGDAVAILVEEYEVERDVLQADLTALVADLRRNGLVEIDAA